MSHTATIETQIKDSGAAAAACRRLGLPEPTQETVELYDGTEATGLVIRLPDWTYPVVCDLQTGKAQYDNFNGHWGEQKHLDQFVQAYATEKAKIEARRMGFNVSEHARQDGSIRLVLRR